MPCVGNGEYNSQDTAPKMLFLVIKWRNVACIKMRKSAPRQDNIIVDLSAVKRS